MLEMEAEKTKTKVIHATHNQLVVQEGQHQIVALWVQMACSHDLRNGDSVGSWQPLKEGNPKNGPWFDILSPALQTGVRQMSLAIPDGWSTGVIMERVGHYHLPLHDRTIPVGGTFYGKLTTPPQGGDVVPATASSAAAAAQQQPGQPAQQPPPLLQPQPKQPEQQPQPQHPGQQQQAAAPRRWALAATPKVAAKAAAQGGDVVPATQDLPTQRILIPVAPPPDRVWHYDIHLGYQGHGNYDPGWLPAGHMDRITPTAGHPVNLLPADPADMWIMDVNEDLDHPNTYEHVDIRYGKDVTTSHQLNRLLRHKPQRGNAGLALDTGGWADIRAASLLTGTSVHRIVHIALHHARNKNVRFEIALATDGRTFIGDEVNIDLSPPGASAFQNLEDPYKGDAALRDDHHACGQHPLRWAQSRPLRRHPMRAGPQLQLGGRLPAGRTRG